MKNNVDIIEVAKKAISIEISELESLKNRININFVKAVEIISQSKAKLIIVGIGKSAHVGKKIVATLNSTGTPSHFLHAAEAIHGDLGVIQKEDVVLCISHSGNSPEIVTLLPHLKRMSFSLIGMTGNLDSKLAKAADVVLDTSIEQEACPNQLAPTSSTTVQMVTGDALAVVLMKTKDFEPNDFAKFHPGGALGKNLTATVGQFLSDNQPKVEITASVKEVIISISASKHGITVVMNGRDIVGVVTDGDLRRMLLTEENFMELQAKDIMSKNPKSTEKSILAKDALQMLKDNNIGQLIVTDQSEYIGIIDIHTLLDEGIV